MTVHSPDPNSDTTRFKVCIALILVLAALLRLYGQDWDDGHYFHPDERFIATVMDGRLSLPSFSEIGTLFDPANSPLNSRSDDENGDPQEFAYGSLPFIVATVLGSLIDSVAGTDLLSYANVGEFGRYLTTIVDLATIGLVVLFARHAFSELAAIIAGLLAACSVVLIQLTNFFTVDTWVTFFTMATLYACLHIARFFSLRWTLIAAGLGGAALATKVSVGVLGLPILVAMLIGIQRLKLDRRTAVIEYVKRLAIAAVPTVVVFMIFEPYALWRPGPFIDDIQNQWEIVNGHFDIPFTRQFVGTISGVNEIENLVLWGIAPGFGIAAIIATGYGLYLAVCQRDPRYLILLSWILPYFYIIASSEARFLRYAAPLVPPLAIIVGHQLAAWWYRTGQPRWQRFSAAAAIGVVCGITLVWSILFMSVYSQTHPRIDASEWIYSNVEPDSTITHEVWDDRLPIAISGQTGHVYDFLALDLYSDRSNEEAVEFVADFLDEADYIVLSSQRLSHSIPRLPWRYPVQSEYYRLLEQEKLGFELTYEATSFPGVGDFRINTLAADESFSVYDHPPVRIFRKVENLSRDEIELRFAHAAQQPRIPQRTPDGPTLRIGEPLDQRDANRSSSWSESLTNNAVVATLVWLVVLGLYSAAAVPLAARLFRSFADIGLGFAPLLGILGAGILAWLAWSLELVRLHPWLAWVALIGFAALSWGLIGVPDSIRRLATRQRRLLAGSMLVFLAGFGFVLLLRSINPDLWHPFYGGEKPMETAYLNAIAQTGEFPPHDPWFADGEINYYYYGFFLFALIWNLTGIPSEIAFQLSLATVAGLLAAGLFSVGATLTGSVLQTRRTEWMFAGGLLSTVVIMLFGNFQAIREIVSNRELAVDFWDSTRVVSFGINEFPYFSFLYGDVHPHMMAAPILVLIVGLATTWVCSQARSDGRWVTTWIVSTGVAAGSLTVVNFWDGPTAAVILLAALTFALFRSGQHLRRQLITSLVAAAGSALIAYGLFARFFERFSTQTGELETTATGTSTSDWFLHFGGLILPVLAVVSWAFYRHLCRRRPNPIMLGLGAGLAIVSLLTSVVVSGGMVGGVVGFVVGGVLFLAASALTVESVASPRRGRITTDAAIGMVALFIVLAGGLSQVRPVAAVSLVLVALFVTLVLNNPQRIAATAIGIAGASGAGLVMVADLVYIADHLNNTDWERMNTIFKLYYQAWTLLGIVAAMSIIWLAHRIWRMTPPSRIAASTALLVFGVIMLAYPVFATGDRLDHQMASSPSFPSLDGNAWMDGGSIENETGDTISFTGDYHAVNWLRDNTDGIPVLLEASIGAYRGGGSRISSATGFASVLGWDGHQSQQRGGADVSPRMSEVREIYQTNDVDRKHELLRRYAIDYVIVGDVERYTIVGDVDDPDNPPYYSTEAGLEAFEQMVGDQLERVFEAENTIVYEVQPFPSIGNGQ